MAVCAALGWPQPHWRCSYRRDPSPAQLRVTTRRTPCATLRPRAAILHRAHRHRGLAPLHQADAAGQTSVDAVTVDVCKPPSRQIRLSAARPSASVNCRASPEATAGRLSTRASPARSTWAGAPPLCARCAPTRRGGDRRRSEQPGRDPHAGALRHQDRQRRRARQLRATPTTRTGPSSHCRVRARPIRADAVEGVASGGWRSAPPSLPPSCPAGHRSSEGTEREHTTGSSTDRVPIP